MKVPKDPDLYLAVFTGIGVTVVMAFWLLTPVYTPNLDQEIEHEVLIEPERALAQVDATLTAAEKTLAAMGVEESDKAMQSDPLDKQAVEKRQLVGKGATNGVLPSSGSDMDAGHDMTDQDHQRDESSHTHEAGGDHEH